MKSNFFKYQHKRLGILLAWGAGSVLAGIVAAVGKEPYRRQFGLQAAVWGAIDAAIAVMGRKGSRAAADRLELGEISREEVDAASGGFGRILMLNAGLDMLYVGGGAWLAKKGHKSGKRGMGAGIIVQGLFLLLYDSVLAVEVQQHRERE